MLRDTDSSSPHGLTVSEEEDSSSSACNNFVIFLSVVLRADILYIYRGIVSVCVCNLDL